MGGIGELVGEYRDAQFFKIVLMALGDIENLGQLSGQVNRSALDQLARRAALQQGDHAFDGNANLLVFGDYLTEHLGHLGEEIEIIDEEREVADGSGGDDQDNAGAQRDGVGVDGFAQFVKEMVLERGLRALGGEGAEAAE